MNGSVAKEVVRAEEPGTEFRSIWTDLRHVPFQQGWLDVKGCRIRYLRSGPSEAPKVIMLAGTGGHAETFVANLGALGKQYDCWAVDIPGCGYSDKPEGSYDSFHVVRDFTDKIENLFLVGRNGMHRYNNQDHSMLTAMVAVEKAPCGVR